MWDKPDLLNTVASLLFAAAFLMVAYGVLHFVVRLPAFPLREVHINGELAHVTLEDLESVVKRDLKGSFFTLDLKAARAGFEALPWVRKSNVRRRWPDRLEVEFEEHVALARWGAVALVNTYGEVFTAGVASVSGVTPSALPLFIGPEGSAKEIAIQYRHFQRSFAAIGQVPVQVKVSPRRAWQIRLDSGLVIELGRERLEQRLERFIAAFEHTIGRLQRKLDYVDLRYPNGFAVRIPELGPRDQQRNVGRNTKRG